MVTVQTVTHRTSTETAAPESRDGAAKKNNSPTNPYLRNSQGSNMGPQSQNRNGSIKKCLKAGASRKKHRASYSRMIVGGQRQFIPELHCRLCKIRAEQGSDKAKNYKKGHHQKCPYKPKRGQDAQVAPLSSFFTSSATMRNNGLIVAPPDKFQQCQIQVDQMTEQTMVHCAGHSTPKTSLKLKKADADTRSNFYETQQATEVDLATDIRREIEIRISEVKNGEKFKWAASTGASVAISLAIDYICSQFEGRRSKSTNSALPFTPVFGESIKRYYELFPSGTATFTFPKDMATIPSRYYHQIEGESFIYLDCSIN